MKENSIKHYSISKKLKREKKVTEDFEVMFNNLSLEEVIALKLELSTKIIKGKLYGLNIYKTLPLIAKDAAVKYAISACKTKKSAAAFLGITYRRLKQLCGKYNLILIEDNCESLGSKSNITSIKERQQVDDYGNLISPAVIDRQYCGTIGRMGSFSFFFSHHMQTMEGGMIACQNKDDADYIRSLRAHGWCRDLPDDNNIYKKTGDPFKDSFTFVTPGYSVRPLEMSGAIGSAQLKKCDKFIEQRRNNAEYFKEKFNDLSSVRIQREIGQSSWFGFSIILEDKLEGKRDIVIKALTEIGVETRPIISGNFMKQPAMEYMNHIHRDNYDNADYLHDNGFFIGNDMTDLKENVDLVYDTIKGCI